jgi:hypothetical protein
MATALAGLEALPTVIATGTGFVGRAPGGTVICAIIAPSHQTGTVLEETKHRIHKHPQGI